MSEATAPQDSINQGIPTPKQFRANFKEIFDAETTFGSPKAVRLELLDSVKDLIQGYLSKGCRMVYLHKRLREAGYNGSRKELAEWLVEQGLWEKRERSEKNPKNAENLGPANSETVSNSFGDEQKNSPTEPPLQSIANQNVVENGIKNQNPLADKNRVATPKTAPTASNSVQEQAKSIGKASRDVSAKASQGRGDSRLK